MLSCAQYHMCYTNTFHCNSSSQAVPRMILREVTCQFVCCYRDVTIYPVVSTITLLLWVYCQCVYVALAHHAYCMYDYERRSSLPPSYLSVHCAGRVLSLSRCVFSETEVACPAAGVETDRSHREGAGVARVRGLV